MLFEKIWEDADFYQIIVKALAKNISAETKVYVTKENIIALSESIKNLIDKHHSEFYWEIGDTDLCAESFFSIGLAEYDNLGHYKFVGSEMCIRDSYKFVLKFGFQNDDNKNYGCSFPMTTETGLLLHFAENVLLLNKDNSFESCMLNGRL